LNIAPNFRAKKNFYSHCLALKMAILSFLKIPVTLYYETLENMAENLNAY
jgi:hypothetical protein